MDIEVAVFILPITDKEGNIKQMIIKRNNAKKDKYSLL